MPLLAEDYQQISHTLVRSNLALDQADIPSWISCFTADGRLEITDSVGGVVALKVGETGLAQFATQAARSSFAAGIARHWNGNLLITEDVDGAALVRSYLVVATNGHDQRVLTTGTVKDRLRRNNGTWQIYDRVVHLDT
ncbi:hypothetical protein AXA44_34400 [Rhodococcus sp. SC4]|nr:hypothetical protein AXA44_34400 [Rhodococcus sp. SC4]